MRLSLVQWLLIVATIALQIAIITVMAKRKSRSAFPYFFNYIVFSFLTLVLQAAVVSRMPPLAYFYLFWISTAIVTILAFAVMREVFVQLLKPYSALVDFGKLLFRWAIVFLALVSLFTAFETTEAGANKLCAVIAGLATCCELMQCGLLLLVVFFQSRLGLSWRSPAICIMFGFGGNAALLLVRTFLSGYFPALEYPLSLMTPIVGVAAYAAWYAGFALPQPERKTVQDSPSRLIFQRWNEAIMATPILSRKGQVAFTPVESFLPGVEQTVERVMARKMMH